MALRPIRQVPDPVLRAVCAAVTEFDAPELQAIAEDMLETMYAAPGRGLAAPQVGLTLRLFVMDTEWKTGTPAPLVAVNPVIVARSDAWAEMEEGCLSIPGEVCLVRRPAGIVLGWHALDGASRTGSFEGFAARCIQHEVDHLDGILCIDRRVAAQPA
jgi:peptide deformylase